VAARNTLYFLVKCFNPRGGFELRNKIFGGIGVLWGGGILVRWFMSGNAAGSDAYQSGQNTAVIFGAVMLLGGLYYFFKKPSD
jgi:LPXTG-motif cell wall-anchored protein